MELNRQNVRNMYHTYYAEERERLRMSDSDGYLTDEDVEKMYEKCLIAEEDGFDWLYEVEDIACFDAKEDGDYNLWDDLREERRYKDDWSKD